MVNTQPGQSVNVMYGGRNYGRNYIHKQLKNNFMEHEQIHLDPVQREAIKQYKLSKDRFKKDIAVLAAAQKEHREHRSVEYSTGDQSRAQQAHAITRVDLRCYYIAYAVFRRLYGGYTKFPEQCDASMTTQEGLIAMMKDDQLLQLPYKYINQIVQTYVPKTVYTG